MTAQLKTKPFIGQANRNHLHLDAIVAIIHPTETQ
jgi:hypothetical protein